MSEQYFSTPLGPGGTLRAPAATLRSKSPSPSRQHPPPDDLLTRLTPTSAVEALKSPTGPLQACLAQASLAEQAFAMKTAVASKTIHGWLDELLRWPWPSRSDGTASGFEMPLSTSRILFTAPGSSDPKKHTSESETAYFGSLPANDVIRYERRIEQIQQEMEELDLEEIKNQVLHNHIRPLSRPGTPFSDAGCSVTSAFSISKMEDLTAVVTAITVQALPALSRVTRLLNTWRLRLRVLRRVPELLAMLQDAEVAMLSGWSAIEPPSHSSSDLIVEDANGRLSLAVISKNDFEVMKTVLQQKVAKPGRDLDFMLDVLEGSPDTLPEEWLERMESVERDYANWVITAEKIVREGESASLPRPKQVNKASLAERSRPEIQIQDASPTRAPKSPELSDYEPTEEEDRESWAVRIVPRKPGNATPPPELDADARSKSGSRSSRSSSRTMERQQTPRSLDGSEDANVDASPKLALSEIARNVVRQPRQLSKVEAYLESPFEEEFEPSLLESVHEEEEEHQLPPTYSETRKASEYSTASTMVPLSRRSPRSRGTSAEPGLPHLPDPDEPFSSDAVSPPSSPPFRYKPRATSVTFKDSPDNVLFHQEDDSPRTPPAPPTGFDGDTPFEWDSLHGSPSRMSITSTTSVDDHLQKQLRELLETIPAKIELERRGINLNPPDLVLPSRPKPRHSDLTRRPTSALSSRADSRATTPFSRSGTPSFMLAPVRDSRPRSTSSHGIRLYHLSRSGEVPIKLFIRCVGEQNERVMVRVGGGWSDLGEYLRDYAVHHGSRSKGESKVEVTDAIPPGHKRTGSSPGDRPDPAVEPPLTPLAIRKTRKTPADEWVPGPPKTPISKASALQDKANTPASETSLKSRNSSHIDWDEEDSSLGLAGPKAGRRRQISDDSKAWIESVKQKVRLASGERLATSTSSEKLRSSLSSQMRGANKAPDDRFGEMGKVGSTKRLFRRN
ncbi:hypothetical protein F5Y17DRAFT_216753 [Xylariaceae sp. FL0594]|nr:hypothetical protein F5Y17DRAFT_216753 [Xylariaceae sp. FL0594]